MQAGMPVFGVCLGHQLMALATGAKTGKLNYGHRGANHPVRDLADRPGVHHQPEPRLRGAAARRWIRPWREVQPCQRQRRHRARACATRAATVFTVQFHPEACARPAGHGSTCSTVLSSMMKEGRINAEESRILKRCWSSGSGPIVIGQAAEFDYAGTQACRALKEEGVEVVLVNSNPATIMTDKAMADKVYIEPLTVDTVKRIIEKEQPDCHAAHPGRPDRPEPGHAAGTRRASWRSTACGCWAPTPSPSTRRRTARRFKDAMEAIGQPCIPSKVVEHRGGRRGLRRGDRLSGHRPPGLSPWAAPAAALPTTEDELREIAASGLRHVAASPRSWSRSCIAGWKEIEFEVMRDGAGNVITVCSMENIDPVGVHTGDSIVVAPAPDAGRQGVPDAPHRRAGHHHGAGHRGRLQLSSSP